MRYKLLKRGNAGKYFRILNLVTKEDITARIADEYHFRLSGENSIAVPPTQPEKGLATERLKLIVENLNRDIGAEAPPHREDI